MVSASWGRLAAIDLSDCNEKIKDKGEIASFVSGLCDEIGMRAYGPLAIERFGSGELEGYSCMQFIETSTIVVHFDENGSRAFIDIFSCSDFDENSAFEFCKGFFGARGGRVRILNRGDLPPKNL